MVGPPAEAAGPSSSASPPALSIAGGQAVRTVALETLVDSDTFKKPLAGWWSAHRNWVANFQPDSNDMQGKPHAPPTPKKCGIRDPSPAQDAAYGEAKQACQQASK